MGKFSLKRRIILPLLFSGLILVLSGVYFVSQVEKRQIEDATQQQAKSLQGHLQTILMAKAEVMADALSFIAQDERIIAALKAGDRDKLLALSQPLYDRLNKVNNVTHFYFDDARRVNLLRVHQPERHDDVINRFTTLAAERDGVVSSGIELGPLGTFTLRSVLPIYEHGKLLGFIELGQEIDSLIQQTYTVFGVDLYMLIDKHYLDRGNWESGMTMLERPFDWNQLSAAVLVSQSMADVPIDTLKRVVFGQAGAPIHVEEVIQLHKNQYSAGIIPVQDAGGRPVATLVMLANTSHLMWHSRMDITAFITIFIVIGVAILILLYIILGRTEQMLAVARQQLVDEGRAREEMQAGFIHQLQGEQQKLRESEEDTRLLLNAVGEGIYGQDMQGSSTFINPAACRMLGYAKDELLGEPMHATIHHSHADGAPYQHENCPMHASVVDGQTRHVTDEVLWRKDGSSFPVEYISTPVVKAGETTGAVVVFTDITERKRAQMEIARALHVQRVLDTILNISLPPMSMSEVLLAALDAILDLPAFVLLRKGSIFLVHGEPATLEMVVQRNLPDELLQSCGRIAFGHCLCGKAAASREVVFSAHVDQTHEIQFDGMKPHGHYCIPIISGGALLGVLNLYIPDGHVDDEEERNHLKTVADTMAVVIERKQAEQTLMQLAHHDMLTGLPNRTLFYDRLEQVLASAKRRKEVFSVLFLDLDHFKEINDTLGHDVGDLVLKQTSERLLACVERKADTVARMGGDEFTIILTEMVVMENAGVVAERIIKALSQPFALDGKPYQLGCSVGIAHYPAHGEDGETLIKHADAAMYQAKQTGRNRVICFSQAMGKVDPS